MSLQTDAIFIKALATSDTISSYVDDRIYSTAIPLPEDDAENVPVPYIIVTFEGMQNDAGTKDSLYESDYDTVQISVGVTAVDRSQLATLTALVRETIRDFFISTDELDEDGDLVPIDYRLSAQSVIFDEFKPCFWQVLNYQCDTKRDIIYEQEEGDQEPTA